MAKCLSVLIFFICCGNASAQHVDTLSINAICARAYRIHEDSAETAKSLSELALSQSVSIGYPKGEGEACIILGAIYKNKDSIVLSNRYFHRALKVRRSIGDSTRVAAAIQNLAINQFLQSKYDSAIALTLYAINLIEHKPNPDRMLLGSSYLMLSNIYDEYAEPDESLRYARKSLKEYILTNDNELVGKAAYALGNRFYQQDQLDSAEHYYNLAYNNFMNGSKSNRNLADILINKANICKDRADFDKAETCFLEATPYLNRLDDATSWFYWHLGRADLFSKKQNWTKALESLRQAQRYEEESGDNWLDQQYLYEALADTYAELGMPDSAYHYQAAAYAVRDSIYTEQKQKAFIRFQTERHKTEAAIGEAKAQKESERARLFFLTALLLSLLLATLAYLYVQNRRSYRLISRQKEIMHQQTVDELIQNSELRYLSAGLEGRETERESIARELHDHLGSTIVTLSWQYDAILENTRQDSANYLPMLKLNDSLKQLYQDVRHLAHQLGSGVLERAGLVPVLEELCHNMEAGNRMEVSFSHFGMENRLGFTYEVNILRVIQELVSNVLKYANATQLIIQINLIDDVLNIMVEDNGIGFDQKAALQRSGAGLSNIEARLRGLNGTIQFENRPVGGTTVIINIPIPKPDLFYEQAH
jgi:two-component system NarL family sensor kinase